MSDFFNHSYDSILGFIIAFGILTSIHESWQKKRQQRSCASAEELARQGQTCLDVEILLNLAEKADALRAVQNPNRKTLSVINSVRRRLYFQALRRLLESHRFPR